MATLDYTPSIDGASYDPIDHGGQVVQLRMFGNAERTGTPTVDVGPAAKLSTGLYQFTIADDLTGRYWVTVTWTKDAVAQPFVDATTRVDLPYNPTLVCSPEDVATRLGLPLPLPADMRERILDELVDCHADVEAFLNRPLTPTGTHTLTSAYPVLGVDVLDYRAWPQTQVYDDDVTILAAVANDDGSYDVTVQTGLDGANARPVRRYVIAHAVDSLRNDPQFAQAHRRIISLSTEGQSVSFDRNPTEDGQAGSLPNIKTLAGFKRQPVFRRARTPDQPWPYRIGPLLRVW